MKSIRELRDPAHQADVARIARAVAETVEKICEVNGYDRRAAGVLALRASTSGQKNSAHGLHSKPPT